MAARQVENFQDKTLSKIIMDKFDKIVGEVDISRLKQIKTLKVGRRRRMQGIERMTGWEGYKTGRAIRDLTGIEYCPNLVEIQFSNQAVSDLSPLSELTALQKLRLPGNNVDDISPLSGLINLRKLNLNENKISDISALSELSHLKELRLSNNNITDLSSLSEVPSLKNISLRENQIMNIKPLVKNQGLGNKDKVDISMNYINLAEESEDLWDIQALLDRDVEVKYKPQSNPPLLFLLKTFFRGWLK